jgi:glutamate synthase domain-containing protein 3
MSGGVAFVLDESGDFDGRYNPGMVVAKRLAGGADEELLRALIARHHEATDSPRAAELLARWPQVRGAFWRVAPHSLPGHDDARDPGLWFAERALEGLAPAAATVRA